MSRHTCRADHRRAGELADEHVSGLANAVSFRGYLNEAVGQVQYDLRAPVGHDGLDLGVRHRTGTA